jgi:hypothetical protein
MSDLTHGATISPNDDALAREWIEVATRARARHVRRVLGYTALVALMALGVVQFGAILLWAARTTTWWALVPAGIHALALVLAIGMPARSGTSLIAPVQGFRTHLAQRLGDRAARLRALRSAVMLEAALLFAWPLARLIVSGATLRWGVTFTTAICSLAILWPLQRITDAQRAESRRLPGVAGEDER